MKKVTSVFIILTIVLIATIWFSTTAIRQVPEITLIDLDGHTLHTKQRQQKPLLITFWATTCSSCVKEIPHLVELQNQYNDKLDITGVAMAYDPINNVKEMIRRRGINYRIVSDQDGSIANAFGGIKLTPTTFLISPQGDIVYQKIGDVDFQLIHSKIHHMTQASVS